MKCVCFTGHRPAALYGYAEHKIYQPLVQQIESLCERLVDKYGVSEFITGGAQGIDQLAFWAVERLKQRRTDISILNIVYQPFDTQASRWQTHGIFGQDEYNQMIHRANAVVRVCDHPNDYKDCVRALYERNHKMVNASDCVIACYRSDNGNYQTASGGTAECMRYARRKNQLMIILDPLTYDIDKGGVL